MRKLKIFIIFLFYLIPLLIFPQTKESLYSPDQSVILRETFNSEFDCRRNGGTPTDVTFTNGVGEFNGSGSYIDGYNIYCEDISIRIKGELILTNDSYPISNDAYYVLYYDQAGDLLYIRSNSGAAKSLSFTPTDYDDLIITTNQTNVYLYNNGLLIDLDIYSGRFFTINAISEVSGANRRLFANLDLVEIYNRALTAEEVYNLYHDLTFKVPTFTNTLIDFDALQGVCRDSHNDLTLTDVEVKRVEKWYAPYFNCTSSKIDLGSDVVGGVSECTIMGWIKTYSAGESNTGMIITNGEFSFSIDIGKALSYAPADAALAQSSGGNSIEWGKWHFVVAKIKSDGKLTFYIGGKNTAPIISGGEDQNSGTPATGSNNIIGNNTGQTRTLDGYIQSLIAIEDVISYTQIVQYWSSTKTWIE